MKATVYLQCEERERGGGGAALGVVETASFKVSVMGTQQRNKQCVEPEDKHNSAALSAVQQ
jgi:hypothetical protein